MFPVQLFNTPHCTTCLWAVPPYSWLLPHSLIFCQLGRIWCMPGALHGLGCAAPRDCADLLGSGQSRYSDFSEVERLPEILGGLEMMRGFKELWKDIAIAKKSNSWNPCGRNGAHSENSTKRMIVSKLYDSKLIWKSGQNTQYEVIRTCLSKGPNRNSRLKWINCYILADNPLS